MFGPDVYDIRSNLFKILHKLDHVRKPSKMKTEVVMYRVRAYESFQKFETFNPNAGPIITRYFTVANNRESAVELRKHIRECELLSETRVLTADETCYLILGKIVDLNGDIVSGNDLSVHYYVEKQIELSIAGKKENIFATLDVLRVPFFLVGVGPDIFKLLDTTR